MTVDEILEHTVAQGDCRIWQGAVQSKGYGSVTGGTKGSSVLAHRVVYEAQVGPIPEGMTIDHVAARGCISKLCMNVAHMEVVTRSENSRRKSAAQTHCKRGHELSGANLRLTHRANGRTHRVCRQCAAIHNETHRLKVVAS